MARDHAEEDAAVVAIPEDDREYRVVVGQSLIGGSERARGSGAAAGGDADGDSVDSQQQQQLDTSESSGTSAMMMALRQQQPPHKKVRTATGSATPTSSFSNGGEHDDDANEMCVSFRYEFQPASVDKSMPGLVTVDESNGLQVLMGNSTGAPGGILFKGKAIENKEIDCLLIFDGTCFRLEKCPVSYTQLRHVRAPPPPPPPPPPPTRRQVKLIPSTTGSAAPDRVSSISSSATGSTSTADATGIAGSPTKGAVPTAPEPTAGGRGRGQGRGRGRGRGGGRTAAAAPKAKAPAAPRVAKMSSKPAETAKAAATGKASPRRQFQRATGKSAAAVVENGGAKEHQR